MRAVTVPQEVMDLRALLASSNITTRFDAAADLVGLPRLSSIPRPGQASGWEFDDFVKTLKPLGFVVGDRTTHATIIHHSVFKGVLCAPHNPGRGVSQNWRASMAAVADLRRSMVDMLTVVSGLVCALIDRMIRGDLDGFTITDDPNSIRLQLAASVTQSIINDRIQATMANEATKPSPADMEAVDDLRAVFRSLDKEFGIGIRKAFDLIGHNHGEAFALAFRNGQDVKPTTGMAALVIQLRGLLDERRAVAKMEEDEKNRKREARADPTITSERKLTTEEAFQQGMRRAKVAVLERTGAIVKDLEDLLHKAKVRHQQIDTDVPFPAYPGVSDEMRQQVAALHQEIAGIEKTNQELANSLANLRVDYDRLVKDKRAAEDLLADAAGDACRPHLKAIVDVVAAKMNTGDLVQAISAIAEVKVLAEKARGVL